jgi:acyl-CoA thioester hydrolase
VSEPTPTWSAPVRYVECDQQGIVFNGHYLTWADEAATAWWASIGLPYAELAADGEAVVKSAALVWTSSARWGDVVDVHARPGQIGRTSLSLELDVRVGERPCCTVTTTYVWVVDGRSAPWPDRVRALLAG